MIDFLNANASAVLTGSFTLLGALLGWLLTLITAKIQNRPRLSFSIFEGSGEDLDLATKTSPSGFGICIKNFGLVPCMMESFCIYYKGHFLVQCFCVGKDEEPIVPYGKLDYMLMVQDDQAWRRNLTKWYKKPSRFSVLLFKISRRIPGLRYRIASPNRGDVRTRIIAYETGGRKCRSWLELPKPFELLQSELQCSRNRTRI